MTSQHCNLPARNTELQPKRGYTDSIPFGWFFVEYSDELVVGNVRTITCFGQEWVLYRNEKGEIGMLEPYCPHLGAHIGVGGRVDGDLVRCPFHAWGFDKEGYCRDVPYATKMPPILKTRPVLKALTVIERNKIVWAWYHPNNELPMWTIDELPQASSDDWIEYLKYVHGHTSVLTGNATQEGIYRQIQIDADLEVLDPNGKLIPCHYSIDLTQKGPGQMVIRYERMTELWMLFLMTPVTNEKTILRFAFTHRKYQEGTYEYQLVKDLMLEKMGSRGSMSGVYADIPIWNNKIYRERPLLCDGDGPIMKFRAWFKQFYTNKLSVEK